MAPDVKSFFPFRFQVLGAHVVGLLSQPSANNSNLRNKKVEIGFVPFAVRLATLAIQSLVYRTWNQRLNNLFSSEGTEERRGLIYLSEFYLARRTDLLTSLFSIGCGVPDFGKLRTCFLRRVNGALVQITLTELTPNILYDFVDVTLFDGRKGTVGGRTMAL